MKKIHTSQLAKSLPWIFLASWVVSNPSLWHAKGSFSQINSLGYLFGAASFIFFSNSLFLITKWKKFEDWMGGLDKVFQYHQFSGKVGFIFLLLHVFILALKWAPQGPASYFLYVLPFHHRFSVNLGSYAFLLTALILTITISQLLPYHIWKKVHQGMNVVFLMSFFHFFLSNKVAGSNFSNAILYFVSVVGFLSVIYNQFLAKFLVPSFSYKVLGIEAVTGTLIKIALRPKNQKIVFLPGQYAFIHFEEPNFSKEQHPFTLAQKNGTDDLFIYVKNRGDYTKALFQSIRPNWIAFLSGPHGRLDYGSYPRQIWIAGGIGIALFLSWLHSLKREIEAQRQGEESPPFREKSFKSDRGMAIDLFFCCHKKADKGVLEEIEKLKNAGIRVYVFCSEENKRLSSSVIAQICPDYKTCKVFMCGPRKLTTDMRKQLIHQGVKKEDIEYEDFNFF